MPNLYHRLDIASDLYDGFKQDKNVLHVPVPHVPLLLHLCLYNQRGKATPYFSTHANNLNIWDECNQRCDQIGPTSGRVPMLSITWSYYINWIPFFQMPTSLADLISSTLYSLNPNNSLSYYQKAALRIVAIEQALAMVRHMGTVQHNHLCG